jgi:hypothetical protein
VFILAVRICGIISFHKSTEEEIEDTKGVIGICILKKNRQHNGQKKTTKGQTTIYKAYI